MANRNPNAFTDSILRLQPVLKRFLQDPVPAVRGAACSAACSLIRPMVPHRAMLDEIIRLVTGLTRDKFKYVQHLALRCLFELFAKNGEDTKHLVKPVVTSLIESMPRYQLLSKRHAMDVCAQACCIMGEDLVRCDFLPSLARMMSSLWDSMPNKGCDPEHPAIVSVLDVYHALVDALESNMMPLKPQLVFQKCLRIAQRSLVLSRQAEDMKQAPPSIDALVISMDIMELIVSGLNTSAEPILAANPQVVDLLRETLQDRNPYLLHSAASIAGSIASAAPQHLGAQIPVIVLRLARLVQLDEPSLCQNACWALGEIAMFARERMKDGFDPIMARLSPVLINASDNPAGVNANVGALLGRLGIFLAPQVAKGMPLLSNHWARCMCSIKDSTEAAQALQGFHHTLQACGTEAVKYKDISFVVVSAHAKSSDTKVLHAAQQVIDLFKRGTGPANWPKFMTEV